MHDALKNPPILPAALRSPAAHLGLPPAVPGDAEVDTDEGDDHLQQDPDEHVRHHRLLEQLAAELEADEGLRERDADVDPALGAHPLHTAVRHVQVVLSAEGWGYCTSMETGMRMKSGI